MATVTAAPPEIVSPNRLDSDKLYEIIGGRFVEKPPMGAYEQELGSILQEILGPFVKTHGLGRALTEVLFDLRPAVDQSRRPDVAFLSAERWPLNFRSPQGVHAWPVVPDLAVEICSPSNLGEDLLEKMEEYFRAGSRRVWLVHVRTRKIHAYESPTSVRIFAFEDTLSDEALLPGFRLPLAGFFGDEVVGNAPAIGVDSPADAS